MSGRLVARVGSFNRRMKMKLFGDFGRREKMETEGRVVSVGHQFTKTHTDCL